MATHSQKLAWWGHLICGRDRIDITFMGRSPVRIVPENLRAVRALEKALIDNGYLLPIDATGSYACRKISGTDTWSLHAVPIAIDVDYPNNRVQPYELERGFGVDPNFRITEAQVDAVEAIVNSDGTPIWKWLGWRPRSSDPMHFEIDVPPGKTVPTGDNGDGDDMGNGDSGPNVAKWQNYLNRWRALYMPQLSPIAEDGNYGPSTEDRTLEFQQFSNIEATGRCGFFDSSTMAIAIKADR